MKKERIDTGLGQENTILPPQNEHDRRRAPLGVAAVTGALTAALLGGCAHDVPPAPKPGKQYEQTVEAGMAAQLDPVAKLIGTQALQLLHQGHAYTLSDSATETEVRVGYTEGSSVRRRDLAVDVLVGKTDGQPDPAKVEFVQMYGHRYESLRPQLSFDGQLVFSRGVNGDDNMAGRGFLSNAYADGSEAGISAWYGDAKSLPQGLVWDTTDPKQLVNASPVNTAETIAGYATTIWADLYTQLQQ